REGREKEKEGKKESHPWAHNQIRPTFFRFLAVWAPSPTIEIGRPLTRIYDGHIPSSCNSPPPLATFGQKQEACSHFTRGHLLKPPARNRRPLQNNRSWKGPLSHLVQHHHHPPLRIRIGRDLGDHLVQPPCSESSSPAIKQETLTGVGRDSEAIQSNPLLGITESQSGKGPWRSPSQTPSSSRRPLQNNRIQPAAPNNRTAELEGTSEQETPPPPFEIQVDYSLHLRETFTGEMNVQLMQPGARIGRRQLDSNWISPGGGGKARRVICNTQHRVQVGERSLFVPLFSELGGFLKRRLMTQLGNIISASKERGRRMTLGNTIREARKQGCSLRWVVSLHTFICTRKGEDEEGTASGKQGRKEGGKGLEKVEMGMRGREGGRKGGEKGWKREGGKGEKRSGKGRNGNGRKEGKKEGGQEKEGKEEKRIGEMGMRKEGRRKQTKGKKWE
ncbi:High mobility group nucleosome-binding domain-containing protein 5, partial [Ophiophagus hannah]